MHTTRPMLPSRFDWPASVIEGLRLAPQELAVIGRARLPGSAEEVLIPTRLAVSGGRGGDDAGYTLAVVPTGKDVAELYVSIQVRGEAAPRVTDQPLRRGFYPPGRPVPVALPRSLPQGKIVVVKVAVQEGRSFRSASENLWIPE
jgi:hypothetical protein